MKKNAESQGPQKGNCKMYINRIINHITPPVICQIWRTRPTPQAIATATIIASVALEMPANICPESKSLAELVRATPGKKMVTAPIIEGPTSKGVIKLLITKTIRVDKEQLNRILTKLLNCILVTKKENIYETTTAAKEHIISIMPPPNIKQKAVPIKEMPPNLTAKG